MKNILVLGLSLSLLIFTLSLYRDFWTDNQHSKVLSVSAPPVTISLSIGEYRFNLFGYASPKALVTIEGNGIYDQTYADETGYFKFNNRFSPFAPREACLTSKDQFGRQSNPVCLAPFPTRYNVDIGPVLMPPTLSLNREYYYIDDQVILSGQGIPNTTINLSTFIDDKKSFVNYLAHFSAFSWIVKPVEAYAFPNILASTDKKGNFSISLPSNRPEFYRLFAQSVYSKEKSPRSLTLHMKVLPIWMIIIRFLLFLWGLIRGRFIEIVIAVELLFLVVYILRSFFIPHKIARERALAFLPAEALMIREQNALRLIDDRLLMVDD